MSKPTADEPLPSRKLGRTHETARQHERQQPRNHEQPEIQFALGVEARRVVEVEQMRAQQNQQRDPADLFPPVVVVERDVAVIAPRIERAQQKRGPDNQGLANQQDQRAHRVIDIEKPDQLPLAQLIRSRTGLGGCHGLAIVVLRLLHLFGGCSVEHHAQQELVGKFFARALAPAAKASRSSARPSARHRRRWPRWSSPKPESPARSRE